QSAGDGASSLQFTVAGHLPILQYRARTQEVVEVSIAQLPLAMFSETSFSAAEVSCEAGDLLLLLTDGLTEGFDHAGEPTEEECGLERVKALLRTHARDPLEQIEDRLLAAVRAHGVQIDDQTLFLIRRVS